MFKGKVWWLLLCLLGAALAIGYWFRAPIYNWGYEKLGVLEHEVPELSFTTAEEHIDSLKQDRAAALKLGWLLVDKDDLVPTQITSEGVNTVGQYRLKGDYVDHLKDDKWSYRVHTEEPVLGLRSFSLHHPTRRNNIHEFFWQFACREEGLLALDYQLVQVTINDDWKGLYAMEEHFGGDFTQRRGLPGFVIRFEEKDLWKRTAEEGHSVNNQAFLEADIDTYNTNQIRQNPELWGACEAITDKLNAWRNIEIPTTEVFDVKKLATYYALADLCGAHHALKWHNMRCYYNPETELLEPIAFDGSGGSLIDIRAGADPCNKERFYSDFRCRMFSDGAMRDAYIKEARRLWQPEYLGALLKKFQPIEDKCLNILKWEFPYMTFDEMVLWENQVVMKK